MLAAHSFDPRLMWDGARTRAEAVRTEAKQAETA
jgi:uncharacterized paraquat-inducible protein A